MTRIKSQSDSNPEVLIGVRLPSEGSPRSQLSFKWRHSESSPWPGMCCRRHSGVKPFETVKHL